MTFTEHIISFIAPHRCLQCSHEGRLLCRDCSRSLPAAVSRCYRCHAVSEDGKTCEGCRRQTKLYRVQTLTRYESIAKQLVWRMKFERARAGAGEIGELLVPLVEQLPPDAIIVHVPAAPSRIRRRGYDQAELIARSVARRNKQQRLSLLVRHSALQQRGANRKSRQNQAKQAFSARRSDAIRGAHIVLIDYVVTTGATLESAAAVLIAAGAKRVEAIVFAQG